MKKIVSVLLTLSLLFGLVLALPSAPARAESTPAQELTEAFANLNALDSLRMDLDFALDLAIVMSMEGQTILNLPMSIALNLDIEIQKTPYAMRGQMEMHMSSMGQKENKKALMYGEADGDAVISYSSEDDGATWTKKRSEKATISLGDLSTIIGFAKEIQKINMETVDGYDMDVYTAIVDGQYLQQVLDAAGSDNPLSEMMGENGTDGMGDFEVVIYVDRATNLPVRLSIDLASMMKDMLSAAMESSMGMSDVEGMEMKIDISVGAVVCELSQFNSVPFIEIPAAVKAAGTDTDFGLTPVATPSTSTLPPAEISTDYNLPPIGADLSTLPPAEIKTDYDLPPIGADLSTLPPVEIKTDYGLTPVATPSVTELENATIPGVSMPPMGTSGEEDQTGWSVIGTIDGSNWDKDFPMVEVNPGVWVSDALQLKAGDEFKVRMNGSWVVNYGITQGVMIQDGANVVVDRDGTYVITLDLNAMTLIFAAN